MQVLSEGSLLAQVFYQVMSRLHLRVWELCHWGGGIAVYDTSQYDPCVSAEKLYEEMPTPEKYDRENSPNDTSTDEIDKLYPPSSSFWFSRRRKVARRKILVIKHKRMII